MSAIIELFLKLFFIQIVYPIAMEIATRREIDPEFKVKSDQIYDEIKNAKTTDDRKAAARKLYDLQHTN